VKYKPPAFTNEKGTVLLSSMYYALGQLQLKLKGNSSLPVGNGAGGGIEPPTRGLSKQTHIIEIIE
jgi:hypothetical protein